MGIEAILAMLEEEVKDIIPLSDRDRIAEALSLLNHRTSEDREEYMFGSERSAGRTYSFKGKEYEVKLLQHKDEFKGVDIAFTSARTGTSMECLETITKHVAVTIRNSIASLMDENVPFKCIIQF